MNDKDFMEQSTPEAGAGMSRRAAFSARLSAARDKTVDVVNKIGRKGTVVICAVLLVGVAVLLNLILFNGEDAANPGLAIDMNNLSADSGKSEDSSDSTTVYNYFEAMQLSRQQARDEAMEVLLSVAESGTAVEDMKAEALDDIAQIALDIENEANIETLILAKGFAKCVAVVNGDSASVVVQSDGLLPSEIAQISEIVYEQAGIVPANLTIIEKNV